VAASVTGANRLLSLAFGPVSLVALRHQQPARPRPFRLHAGMACSAVAFVLVGWVVYWTGWDTNWKVFALALAGALLLAGLHAYRGDFDGLDVRQSAWFWLFVAGLALASYIGNYGNGLGLLRHGLDMVIVAVLSLAVFWLALNTRLGDAETAAMLVHEDG
jgi:amino acid transporter